MQKNPEDAEVGAVVLLAGCTAAAPTEVETESLETEQEPFLSGQSREEIEIQGSSQGEDIGEISMAGAEDEKWIFQSPYASAYFDFIQNYEVTAIVRWQPSDIVTINYTIPPDEEDPFHTITYENIIWDCLAKDYWRSKERGVSSWKNAGEGGSI